MFVTKWYVGPEPDRCLPLRTSPERIEETQIYRDLYDRSHQHEWVVDFEKTYDWFGLRRSWITESFSWWSWIAGSYESDAGFRTFAHEQIVKGNLTTERLRELLALPSGWINPPAKKTTLQDAPGSTIAAPDDAWVPPDPLPNAPSASEPEIIEVAQ